VKSICLPGATMLTILQDCRDYRNEYVKDIDGMFYVPCVVSHEDKDHIVESIAKVLKIVPCGVKPVIYSELFDSNREIRYYYLPFIKGAKIFSRDHKGRVKFITRNTQLQESTIFSMSDSTPIPMTVGDGFEPCYRLLLEDTAADGNEVEGIAIPTDSSPTENAIPQCLYMQVV